MEITNFITPNALGWKHVNSRIRKDLFAKPASLHAVIKTHSEVVQPEKKKLLYRLELIIKDNTKQTSPELASVAVEAEYPITKLGPNDEPLDYPAMVMIRIGQKAFDTAYGVLLAKSVGSALYGIAVPEISSDAYLPRDIP